MYVAGEWVTSYVCSPVMVNEELALLRSENLKERMACRS